MSMNTPPPGAYPPPAPHPYPAPAPPAPKRRRWVHFVGYPLVAVVAVAIGAASAGAGNAEIGKDVVASAPSTDTASQGGADAAAAADQGKEKPDGVYSFNDVVTFSDGSTLKAGRPVEFTPDQFAAGGEKFKHHVKFKLTFTNRSGKVFDPSLTTGAVSSGGQEGESVYQDGLDAPDNKILPGKSVTWWMGYGVKDSRKVQLTVNVGFLDYDDVIYTNDL